MTPAGHACRSLCFLAVYMSILMLFTVGAACCAWLLRWLLTGPPPPPPPWGTRGRFGGGEHRVRRNGHDER